VNRDGLTREEILRCISSILGDAIDNESLQLSEQDTAEDVAGWDSINHVKLLIGLEAEFGFRFETDEVAGAGNVGELINVIQKKLA
jgi:acyl carrier protein